MNKINILEMSLYKKDNIKVVTKEDVADIIHIKTKIPVYELLKDNRETSIAYTKLEEAQMWAIKGITRSQEYGKEY